MGLSGWGHERGYPQMTDAVRIRAVEIRHPLEPHPFDDAFDGQYHASHAEKQVAELARDQPIAVSREMCEDCQGYFQRLTDYRNTPPIVRDPSKTFIFVPGGVTVTLRHR